MREPEHRPLVRVSAARSCGYRPPAPAGIARPLLRVSPARSCGCQPPAQAGIARPRAILYEFPFTVRRRIIIPYASPTVARNTGYGRCGR
ncbi:MAG: hypothetical protein LBP19_10490 [Treponema sp.]|nr:hypothetical protein [Treponema sp.]